MFTSPRRLRVVALVATKDRPRLLHQRSVPSILAQSRLPDVLIVVDDSADSVQRSATEGHLRTAVPSTITLVVLENERTPGCSGAWNTGIAWMERELGDPQQVFAAILDDDDAWEPNHVEACLAEAAASNSHMVIAGLVRHESECDGGLPLTITRQLEPQEILAGRSHIQGSNLFLRLDTLLMAGGFSEELRSCTDRDLCMKLTDLGDVRASSIGRHTVHHYADGRMDRCSAPSSPQKSEGLTLFWRKYRHRMTEATEEAFRRRALELFHWLPPASHEESPQSRPGRARTATTPIYLIAGIAVDATRPERVEPLLHDLRDLSGRAEIVGLEVLLLENGPRPGSRRPIHELADCMAAAGLRVIVLDIERQTVDARNGLFGPSFPRGTERLPIAQTRTMIQVYAALHAVQRPGAWIWIGDDDKRLFKLVDRGSAQASLEPAFDVSELQAIRRSGVDAVLGPDSGAPPLPFESAFRTQTLDLLQNLRFLAACSPSGPLPDRSDENRQQRREVPDYYHDLARRDTKQLEAPFWLVPAEAGETAQSVLRRMARSLERIFAGEQIFRPVWLPAESAPVESIRRGGSAFFFDPMMLLSVPNTLARLGGRFTRRSDMVGLLVQRDHHARIVKSSSAAAVLHDRRSFEPASFDIDKVRDDILGFALYSALEDVLRRRERRRDLLDFSEEDLVFGVRRFKKYVRERLCALRMSAWRIAGLVQSLRHFLLAPSWIAEDESAMLVREFVERMAMVPSNLADVSSGVTILDDATIRAFFATLRLGTDEFKHTFEGIKTRQYRFDTEREAFARTRVQTLFGASSLRHLGTGSEGVAFTDGDRVFKFIDYWKAAEARERRDFLRTLVGRWSGTSGLYPILEVRDDGPHSIVVYPYEQGEPYSGGHGPELVQLLEECRRKGVVSRNIHPKNLIVTATGVRLIDYGSDLRPSSDAEFREMAKRVWLTWRWHHRQDLSEVMHRALRDESIPELDGFERLWKALDVRTPSEILTGPLVERAKALRPRRVLDYGCGKAGLARRLASLGMEVTGYDPDVRLAPRWTEDGPQARLSLTHDRRVVLDGSGYDLVICRLVLCEIADGPGYVQAIQDLRQLTRPGGRVVVVVCNPYFAFGGPTPLHRQRRLPAKAVYEDSFEYVESVNSGEPRREVHRPHSRLRRDLLRAGLIEESVYQTETVDLDRFEPASDFLVMELSPVEPARERTSLVIKTCAMEWETVEVQVEHLVKQLEEPHGFHERILAVDSRTHGYLRQYAPADNERFALAVERLLSRGLIDKVVFPPIDVRALYSRWFGTEAQDTHAANGAQLAVTLAAFEASSGDLILHVDSDIMVARLDRRHDYLAELAAVLARDRNAVTVSLGIAANSSTPFTSESAKGAWRVETRAGLLHRQRLMAARPLPNEPLAGSLRLPWHRSLDEVIRQGRARSYRGGDDRAFFVHPPNARKRDGDEWLTLLDRIETSNVPAVQLGSVDLVGDLADWFPRVRYERFIFVVTGRNVMPGRLQRCLDSMQRQARKDWGAIVIDDASSTCSGDYLSMVLAPHRDRVTLIRPRRRRGLLANLCLAIEHVCGDPRSVIITLDADDALIGSTVLDKIDAAYEAGADVTVGSMLRTDKHVNYVVDFTSPRSRRGGNVWQHLRTFQKKLWDAIDSEALRLDGRYVDVATDWAFMVPIIESARKPVWIQEPLYLYEPSGLGKGADRERREEIISRLLAKGNRHPALEDA